MMRCRGRHWNKTCNEAQWHLACQWHLQLSVGFNLPSSPSSSIIFHHYGVLSFLANANEFVASLNHSRLPLLVNHLATTERHRSSVLFEASSHAPAQHSDEQCDQQPTEFEDHRRPCGKMSNPQPPSTEPACFHYEGSFKPQQAS